MAGEDGGVAVATFKAGGGLIVAPAGFATVGALVASGSTSVVGAPLPTEARVGAAGVDAGFGAGVGVGAVPGSRATSGVDVFPRLRKGGADVAEASHLGACGSNGESDPLERALPAAAVTLPALAFVTADGATAVEAPVVGAARDADAGLPSSIRCGTEHAAMVIASSAAMPVCTAPDAPPRLRHENPVRFSFTR